MNEHTKDRTGFVLALMIVPIILIMACVAVVYVALGKLEPESVRLIAAGSLCAGPIFGLLSAVFFWTFFRNLNRRTEEVRKDTQDNAMSHTEAILGAVVGAMRTARAPVAAKPELGAYPAQPYNPRWPVIVDMPSGDGQPLNLSD